MTNAEQYYNVLRVNPSAVVIDAEDAQQIWQLFRHSPIAPGRLDRLDSRAFLQAALMAAIDGSYAMGYVEGIFRAAFMKPVFDAKSFEKVLKALTKAVVKQYWRTSGGRDLSKVAIYQTTISMLNYQLRPYFDEIAGKMGDD